MTKTKPSRKELLKEPDEFLTLTGKLLQWAAAHKTHLTYGAVIFAALLLAISGYRFFSLRAEAKAAGMLQTATAAYGSARMENGPETAYQTVAPEFESLLKKYGGTSSGDIARYQFANICYDAGKFQQAIELYKAALVDFDSDAIIKRQILCGLGYAHEQTNDLQTAAAYFKQILDSGDGPMLDEILFNLGRLYSRMGNSRKSEENYQRLLENYPGSIYAELVREKIHG